MKVKIELLVSVSISYENRLTIFMLRGDPTGHDCLVGGKRNTPQSPPPGGLQQQQPHVNPPWRGFTRIGFLDLTPLTPLPYRGRGAWGPRQSLSSPFPTREGG